MIKAVRSDTETGQHGLGAGIQIIAVTVLEFFLDSAIAFQ